jgi:hypothetical protein
MTEKKLIPITPVTAAVEETCPPATQDITINLENRKNAIDTAMYGPLNPAEPNEEYWTALGAEWGVDTETAKKQTCGNCAVFIQTPEMLSCIETGLTDNADEFDAIDAAGELGYCEAFDFKCASARTCRAWVAGGPVTEEKTVEEPVVEEVVPAVVAEPVQAKVATNRVSFGVRAEKALQTKVSEYNKYAASDRKASLAMVKAVYRRGASSFSVSQHQGTTRSRWAMTRVDAFLRLLSAGKPLNASYKADNDLLPISHPRSTKISSKGQAVTASGLIPEEQALAEALVYITEKYGKFDQDGDGVWAGYTPAAENEVKDIGVACMNCVFYKHDDEGKDVCQIISLEIEDLGKCRFAVIPEGVVKGYDIPLRDKNSLELLLASAYAEGELAIDLNYETPEQAIVALTELSGLGYEAEPAIRASWLRAVKNGEDPFKRASMLATMKHNSLDADLLPKGDM